MTDWTQVLALAMPKVVLHDHLDGGLRPETLAELAAEVGHDLPEDDPIALARHLHAGAWRRDLELYLEGFTHTVAVLQTPEALARVARESLEDLAADGVVYAELRFAPELNTQQGLTLDEVVEAALAGMAEGPIPAGLVLDGMRTSPVEVVREAAEVAIAFHGRGVVGFDLAGAESFHPARVHAEALDALAEAGVPLTLHAGEAHGPTMVTEAIDRFGARRIGHGVTLVDDLDGDRLGPAVLAVRERDVMVECCPTSNVHTGAVDTLADHPIERFRELGLRVSLNTDNRLMSDVTMSSELLAVARAFDWTTDDALAVARDSLDAAFTTDEVRTTVHATIDETATRLTD
ncbi:adenosine deaminase [Salsipaludibacter albus]|uniref:adenosine deaminase n=1 Tax=Salsipaludibacter albus TaxID=2849650 RepID=UPI001EE4E1EB|nr:adenosine deaminase [Salsipaludibacter albus]MBY5163547.1 adenosine deaminase [Salsipaludibacter albus]